MYLVIQQYLLLFFEDYNCFLKNWLSQTRVLVEVLLILFLTFFIAELLPLRSYGSIFQVNNGSIFWFFLGLVSYINNFMIKKAEMKIIVAGPGFAREDLMKLIKDSDLKNKIITDGLSHTGEVGLQELINRGTIEKIIKIMSL